jgi:MFS family permease
VTEGAAAPGANGKYLDALRVGEFRALFAAYTVSMLGDIVAAVAMTVLVFQRTGSPFLAGVTFTLAFVPYLFSGALLSSLVDRVPPRRLMIACDLLSAAIVALMASSGVPVPALLALLFLLGLISPVAGGMRNRLLVVVLPAGAFIAGRSLFRIVAQSAQVVGNAAGGLLIALTSPRGALLLDCASFLGSALVVRMATRWR